MKKYLPLLALTTPRVHAWGEEGHRIINRLAASSLPEDVPAFLHTYAAISEIEYLGPEPDRWRNHAEPELLSAQAPEHFINLELADSIGQLPSKRFDFLAIRLRRPSGSSKNRPPTLGGNRSLGASQGCLS